MLIRISAAIFAFFWLATNAYAQEPQFILPLDCDLGETCHIQQFVDHDKSGRHADYACGTATYDGHKGTDFRIVDLEQMRKGVDILAAEVGIISARRNNMDDRIKKTADERKAIAGRECGNGVVIAHQNGWKTQYCHMKKGSVSVNQGQSVKPGDKIGQVGLSGDTQFPHLHFQVTRDKEIIDPFSPEQTKNKCDYSLADTLWKRSFLDSYTVNPTQIVTWGFAPETVEFDEIQQAKFANFQPNKDSPALVAYVMAINLKKDDQISIRIIGPQGEIISNVGKPLDRAKARYTQFSGKKRPRDGWPHGSYQSTISIIRDGQTIATKAPGINVN